MNNLYSDLESPTPRKEEGFPVLSLAGLEVEVF
jgi:hypothetical protein